MRIPSSARLSTWTLETLYQMAMRHADIRDPVERYLETLYQMMGTKMSAVPATDLPSTTQAAAHMAIALGYRPRAIA